MRSSVAFHQRGHAFFLAGEFNRAAICAVLTLSAALRSVYSEDRKGIHPAGHLASFQGVLEIDGYAGFKRHTKSHELASLLPRKWQRMNQLITRPEHCAVAA